jgi:hypothetical protein
MKPLLFWTPNLSAEITVDLFQVLIKIHQGEEKLVASPHICESIIFYVRQSFENGSRDL